jgi:SMI1 / KNR4 family (SUKH-1)
MNNLTAKSIETYIQEMTETGVIDPSEIEGCTDKEIYALEKKYNLALPASYKSFLLYLGKSASTLVDRKEYSIDYAAVLRMTEYERRIIQECKEEDPSEDILDLPENALLILGRSDGSQFYYILAEGGEDSEVYYYNSDTEIIKKEYDSFWKVLDMFIEGLRVSQ